MELIIEIIRIVLPILIVGGIGVFIILRLKNKYKQGNLGKKNSERAQNILDSLIPLCMLFGCLIGVILSIFSPTSSLSIVSVGAGIGLLVGYFAYEIYSKIGKSPS